MLAPKLICITGNTATGTTTLTRNLSKYLGWKAYYSEDYLSASPYFPSFLNQPARWAFHNQVFFIAQYVEAYQSITGSLSQADQTYCLDYSIFELHIYTKTMWKMRYIDANEYNTLNKLLNTYKLVTPDILLYLSASTDVILERIRQRGRTSELNLDRKYISELQVSFNEYTKNWSTSPIFYIDSEKYDFLKASVVKEIAEVIYLQLNKL